MAKLEAIDLRYDYAWNVRQDEQQLSDEAIRQLRLDEGYEMLAFLNTLNLSTDRTQIVIAHGIELQHCDRLYVEWMLKEHYQVTSS